MKHLVALTAEKPAQAEQWAWIDLKQIFGFQALTQQQALWLTGALYNALRK